MIRTPLRHCVGVVGLLVSLCVRVEAVAQSEPLEVTPIPVRVDPAVEILSVVFRLAGNSEYGQGKVESYTLAADRHFEPHRGDPVVALAAELRRRQGVSYDAVASLAVHLDGTLEFESRVPLQPRPDSLDERWGSAAPRFVRALQRFAKKSDFAAFWKSQRELYEVAEGRMRERLRESAEFDWFDEFFGARPTASFEVSLGLLNGGACYGPRVLHRDGTEDLHCVLGVWNVDGEGFPQFDEAVVSTVVHEFCHSYCNRLVDEHLDELEAAAQILWPHVAESMREQAYGNWQTMMRESLVRACVIRYLAKTEGPRARELEIGNQVRRQFHWAGELSDLLIEFEQQREQFPTLDTFMPKVVEFFDRYAANFDALQASAPKVVSIVPTIGERSVDPALTEIVITFDREMLDGAWAVVGGGPNFPELVGRPRYDTGNKVLRLQVELEPEHDYEFWLNRGKYDSFQSADRKKLQPVHVTFRTAKASR